MIESRSRRLAVLAGAVALLVTACGSSASSAPSDSAAASTSGSPAAAPISVAGVYENTQDAFWGTFLCGAQSKATELGVDFKSFTNATADNTKMSNLLDSALLTNPSGVIFNPIDTTPWEAKIASVMKEGTPVIGAQAAPASQAGYVTSNGDGSLWAQDVVDLVKDETGKAVVLNGMADAQWQKDRLDAIVAAVKTGAPGITFLPPQIDGFDVNKGTQIISGLITANPDLKLILAVAGPEGQAVAAAIKQTGMTGKIRAVAFDAVPAEVDGVRGGQIDMLIAQPAFAMGEAQLGALVDYLKTRNGSTDPVATGVVPPKTLDLGKITKDNVDAPESQAFIYTASCS